MTIDEKVNDKKPQYNLIEKPSKIDKYEYRSGEETLTSGPS